MFTAAQCCHRGGKAIRVPLLSDPLALFFPLNFFFGKNQSFFFFFLIDTGGQWSCNEVLNFAHDGVNES